MKTLTVLFVATLCLGVVKPLLTVAVLAVILTFCYIYWPLILGVWGLLLAGKWINGKRTANTPRRYERARVREYNDHPPQPNRD